MQSVRPSHEFDIQELSDEENADEEDDSGMEGEKIMVKRDDEVIKKLKDPKLPTVEELDNHYVCLL